MSSYPSLRVAIEDLIETMIARSTSLKSMDVDRTLPKPKQKSHAKSILQQKRMALADYFKTLSHIGVSYRSGNLARKNRPSEVIDLTVPPVDLSAGLQKFKHEKVDKQMLAQWDGCEAYYYKSLIKLNALNGALSKTQSDLGLPNMERCSGSSTHVMLMAHRQKRVLADSFNSYVSLRVHVTNLSSVDESSSNVPRYRELRECASRLKTLLITLETSLEQMELYLQACPGDPGVEESPEILTLETSGLAIVNATRNDPVWEEANSKLRRCLGSLKPLVERHGKLFADEVLIMTPVHYKYLDDSSKILENVRVQITEFGNMFGDRSTQPHPIHENIDYLETAIEFWVEKFLLMEVPENESQNSVSQSEESMADYTSSIELLIKTILLTIQQKYKETSSEDHRESASELVEKNVEDPTDEVEDKLEENGLREKLIESLEKDVTSLRLEEVRQRLVDLLKLAANDDDPSRSSIRRALLVRCLPLLRQYLLFAQFYLNEQVAAFRVTCKLLDIQLNVFIDLATNGFCVPKDLDLEEGEGDEQQEGKTQNGMGLGDGEGEKDVSDRIESEDQLDDARPADQEKDKQEDKDCKEEENGIDMSEDFDAKMQDLERNEDDDNERKSDDEDTEDLDKQMGDTEKGADALDEEIWGDKDESEDENADQDEENEGRGEEVGEKEMTAKDDTKKKNEKNEADDEDGERAEEEKKDINEIDEPETNDDQIDPYHGNHEPLPEPEPMDLPDDINLDGEDANEDDRQDNEENPFDIDGMKECMPPPEDKEGDDPVSFIIENYF